MKRRYLLLTVLISISLLVVFTLSQDSLQKKERKSQLEKALDKTLYFNSQDTSRAVTFNEIGIYYDSTSESIYINREKLDNYLIELEREYAYLSNNTIISFENYSFQVPSDKAKIKLYRAPFSTNESILNLVTNPEVKLRLYLDTLDDPDLQKQKTDSHIEKITSPLLIKYGRNPIYIPKATLKDFIVSEGQNPITARIDYDKVSQYLDTLHEKYKTDDVNVIHKEAVDAIRRSLLFRAADYQVNNAVILPIQGNPKSDGSLHDVYLEVIKSQQRLYRFEHGKLVKTYIVSTGLTWETPPGEYSIQGKQKITISYTGNWYMPDYLPIGTINGSYRFGFHAIPYHMDGNGNIFSRDPNTMGSPATGGCIQLTPEEATELFEWAWVGIPVYVYE